MPSWNGNISRVTGPLWGNPPGLFSKKDDSFPQSIDFVYNIQIHDNIDIMAFNNAHWYW